MKLHALVGFGLYALAVLSLAAAPGYAETRIALVIGNSDYAVAPLKNPANDADLMTRTLREVGFEVHEYRDVGRRDLTRAFYDFERRLRNAGDDTVAIVYFAGHGAQLGGENYLIPVDAELVDEIDIEIEGVRASSLLETFRRTNTRLNIIVLDACRNNPFAAGSRSASGGLARMDAPTGTLLAFSTAPGRVALDGDGRNSPYTMALARAIKTPGAKVEDVFKRTRVSVMDRTNDQQVPWESSSLTGDFYFIPQQQEQQPVAGTPEPPGGSADMTVEIEYWKSIADSDDAAMFQSYLNRFPDGAFADLAERRVAALGDEQRRPEAPTRDPATVAWDSIKDSTDPALLERFIRQYPDSAHAALAESKLSALEAAYGQDEGDRSGIPAILPHKHSVAPGAVLPIDGIWTVSTIDKRIRIERGRAYAVDSWRHLVIMSIRRDMVVLRDFERIEAGVYTAEDLPLIGRATMRLIAANTLAVRVDAAVGPISYNLIRRAVDDPVALDADFAASLANRQTGDQSQ